MISCYMLHRNFCVLLNLIKGQRLFLDEEVHFRMALLIAEACTVHLKGKAISGLFTDGSKQVYNQSKSHLNYSVNFQGKYWIEI